MERKISVIIYCPRCKGRIFRNKDEDGWHEQCIRCGYIRYLDAAPSDRQGDRPPGFRNIRKMAK